MNPYKALIGQSGGLAAALIVGWLLSPAEITAWLVAIGAAVVAFSSLLWSNYFYLRLARLVRASDSQQEPTSVKATPWRRGGDALALIETALPVVFIGGTVMLFGNEGPGADLPLALEGATALALFSTMLAIVLGSSMVDWIYILPRRDGLVRLPPCMSAGESRWRAITKTWLRHRFVAELSFVLFFLVTGPVIVIEAYFFESGEHQWLTKVVTPLFTLFAIPFGYSKSRLLVGTSGMTGVNSGVKFALGDTISWQTPKGAEPRKIGQWRTPFLLGTRFRIVREKKSPKPAPTIASRGDREYVFDVGLDEATLFRLRAKRNKQGFVKELKAPTMALLTPGAVRIHDDVSSPCAAGCQSLHKRCERLPTRPGA